MYTGYGNSYVARVVSNEKVNSHRESISLSFSGVWMNTLRNRFYALIESLQVRQTRQVSCQEGVQFC